jgi:hypothetical protein
MDDFWIKSLGISGDLMQDDWKNESNGLFLRAATFDHKPGMKRGDGIVFYATGRGVIFAAGVLTSIPYKLDADHRWNWRVDVDVTHGAPYIHNGVALEELNTGARNHRVRIQRRSHVRLTEEEYEMALELLPPLAQ